jgi:hypothetical protein
MQGSFITDVSYISTCERMGCAISMKLLGITEGEHMLSDLKIN